MPTNKKSRFAPWAEPPKGVLVEGNLLLIENEGGHFLVGRFLREDEKYLVLHSEWWHTPSFPFSGNPVYTLKEIVKKITVLTQDKKGKS